MSAVLGLLVYDFVLVTNVDPGTYENGMVDGISSELEPDFSGAVAVLIGDAGGACDVAGG